MSLAYGHQPGGIQPPGMAHGQPMGPAQAHPGPVGHPMALHPGVSGATGPHVTQAGPMMAAMQMQPGVGGPGAPSTQALLHLTPNQQMMPQQVQQASKSNYFPSSAALLNADNFLGSCAKSDVANAHSTTTTPAAPAAHKYDD